MSHAFIKLNKKYYVLFFFIGSCTSPQIPPENTGTDTNKTVEIQNSNSSSTGTVQGQTPEDEIKVDNSRTWRSTLFPVNWQPKNDLGQGGMVDAQGRFLPDFSYAGYHRGEEPVNWDPNRISKTISIDQNMYGNGVDNATMAIQIAIDTLCAEANPEKKLRVVHIPAGTYLLKIPNEQAKAAIHIHCSYLLLSGEGENTKLLFNDPEHARNKAVILLGGNGSFYDQQQYDQQQIVGNLTQDTVAEQRQIQVSSTANIAAGDWVLVRNQITPAFKEEHRMENYWTNFNGLFYARKVLSKTANAITLDIPLRYPLKKRDNTKVLKLNEAKFVEESGIATLSIGMVQSAPPAAPGSSESAIDNSYDISGTPAYKVAYSSAIKVEGAHHLWISGVTSFQPQQNHGSGVHVLSHGISIGFSAFRISVDNCNFGPPQYRGGGGNGYLYNIQGSDNLISRSISTNARHGISINQAASGNVFQKLILNSSRLSDDTHKFLAHANLWDSITLDDAFLSAVNRGNSSGNAGFTSTAGVFWNTHVKKNHKYLKNCAVESVQWGWGYVIGTSASVGQNASICVQTKSNPIYAQLDQDPLKEDFAEGEGKGATLTPQSLYDAQLKLRLCQLKKQNNCSVD